MRYLLLLAFLFPAVATAQVPPPAGATHLFDLAADGIQLYACEARDGGFGWVFKAPEAALFDTTGRQQGIHGAGPFWQAADGSRVVGAVTASAPAPTAGAIPWLLLRATPQGGPGRMATIAWVRRFDTVGGTAPPDGCDAAHQGATVRMRYSANYGFFAP